MQAWARGAYAGGEGRASSKDVDDKLDIAVVGTGR